MQVCDMMKAVHHFAIITTANIKGASSREVHRNVSNKCSFLVAEIPN